MDRYHIALFVHLLTIISAASATTVATLATSRRIRARTVGEALEWHTLILTSARVFPVCLVSFLATGFYMMGITGGSRLSVGYIDAGLVGVTLLLASGAYLRQKGGVLRRVLQEAAARDAGAAPPRLVLPKAVVVLPVVNSGIAVAVAFDMVTKPASIPVALGIIALGVAIGAVAGARQLPPRMHEVKTPPERAVLS